MFDRADLFRIRTQLVEVFHETSDEQVRRCAFNLIWKINERLLRGSWR